MLLFGVCLAAFFRQFKQYLQAEEEIDEARSRISLEESLALEYLDSMKGGDESVVQAPDTAPSASEDQASLGDWKNWSDGWYNENGVIYTPDYAKGFLDCVLEYPKLGIVRGIYNGTQQEINHDLDIWMLTAARPDIVLGGTAYVILGHNHPAYNVSLNRLQDAQPGDRFTLTAWHGSYQYKVASVTIWDRNLAVEQIINGKRPYTEAYLISCARNADGSNAGTYLVVQGILE